MLKETRTENIHSAPNQHEDTELSSVTVATPLTPDATRAMFLGSGELAKEVVIELQRLSIETCACGRYQDAAAMQVAHSQRCFSMLDGDLLRRTIQSYSPPIVVPEIEVIHTDTLVSLEGPGTIVVPNAFACHVTMNRERIRRLVAENLKLPTSVYQFASTENDFK